MRLKDDSVRPVDIHPRMSESILGPIDTVVRDFLGYEPVLTSCNDGHEDRPNSLHHHGKAVDVRTWTTADSGIQIQNGDRRELCIRLQNKLGPDFDVIAEGNHIHIELDPDD